MMRTMSATALVMLAAVATAGAQTPPARSRSTDSLAFAIRQLPVASRIRLVMHGGERTLAEDPHVQDDSLVAKINGHAFAFPLAQIDTLWVNNGRRAGRGAMLVGIPFAVLGAIVGASFACSVDHTPSCNNADNTFGGAALFTVILGVPAAVAGAIVGWAIIRWKRVFVRTPL